MALADISALCGFAYKAIYSKGEIGEPGKAWPTETTGLAVLLMIGPISCDDTRATLAD